MSRRADIVMSETEVDAYLVSQLTMIIISNGLQGYPHPMPMHFCIGEDRTIAMTTFKKSQKVANYRRDPRASLLVESGTTYEALRSVLIYARAEIIDDLDATAQCMIDCRAHSNDVRGTPRTLEDDQAFATTARIRAAKRLVLKFHPERYISWDHAKLGGRY